MIKKLMYSYCNSLENAKLFEEFTTSGTVVSLSKNFAGSNNIYKVIHIILYNRNVLIYNWDIQVNHQTTIPVHTI